MPADTLVRDLTASLAEIPLIDPHSHIDPLSPASKSLDDILGYHYYTELAHSAGMSQAPLAKDVSPRERRNSSRACRPRAASKSAVRRRSAGWSQKAAVSGPRSSTPSAIQSTPSAMPRPAGSNRSDSAWRYRGGAECFPSRLNF